MVGAPEDECADTPLAWTTLWRRARQTPGLLAWLLAATLCSLMDETLVALCALWVKHRFASDGAVEYDRVIGVGLGGTEDCHPQALLSLGGKVGKLIKESKSTASDLLLDSFFNAPASVSGKDAPKDYAGRPLLDQALTKEDIAEKILLGVLLALYDFNQYKSKKDDFAPEIRVRCDPAAGTLTVADTGAGLTREEIVRYLATIGGCRLCHTPHDEKGRPIEAEAFTGGWLLPGPWGRVVSANLTPDPDNYVGQASREEFIDRFKSLEPLSGENAPVAPPGRNTVMAWPEFAGMTREDVRALLPQIMPDVRAWVAKQNGLAQ